jgi:hypothetical protein
MPRYLDKSKSAKIQMMFDKLTAASYHGWMFREALANDDEAYQCAERLVILLEDYFEENGISID